MKLDDYMSTFNIEPKTLADFCGVTVQAISQYKLGKRKPKPEIAQRIVAYTRGEVAWSDLYATTTIRKSSAPVTVRA